MTQNDGRALTRLRRAAQAAILLAIAIAAPGFQGCGGGSDPSCCRVCTTGKACGDGCIAVGLVCNTTGGCACNE